MRTAICTAMLILIFPAMCGAAEPVAAPAPPPVTYDVWGFRWDGRQYVKQPAYTLNTPDIKKAADFAAEITSYAGWSATTNLPAACIVHTTFRGPRISGAGPSEFPNKPSYTVWAFKLANGNWVKDDAYCWTTADPRQGLAYAAKVNAVPGWAATDNCPSPVPRAQRFVDGGTVHGADAYRNLPFQVCDAGYGASRRIEYRQQFNLPWLGGWGLNLNALANHAIANGNYSDDGSSSDVAYTPSPSYDSSNDIQNMLNTQQAINTQQMIDNQNMLNTQDMFNTQNMVNNLQEMVNTQNMVDTQYMINAMQANP